MSRSSSRVFGMYLVGLSVLQMGLYAYLVSGGPGEKVWLRYSAMDSRCFWSLIERGITGADAKHLTLVGVISALWILALGILFVSGRLPFITYIVSELILGVPQTLFALPWGLLMVSEGVDVLTSLSPILLAVLFTLVPISWAIFLAIYGKLDN